MVIYKKSFIPIVVQSSQLLASSVYDYCSLYLAEFSSDYVVHTQTSDPVVSLILLEHRTSVSLLLETINGTYPPSDSGLEPVLSKWKACVVPLHY